MSKVFTKCLVLQLLICVTGGLVTPSDDFNTEYGVEIIRYSKSAEIRNLMNETVDPCENFYSFACGRWKRINPANSREHITTGFFETLQEALNRKISDVLVVHDDGGSDNEVDNKVRHFYASCMHLPKLDNKDYKAKLEEIVHEFGQMPVLQGAAWSEHDFDWLQTVAEISYKYGIHIIFGYDIMVDFVDNSLNRVYIGYHKLPLESKSMYLDEVNGVYRDNYQQNIAKILRRFLDLDSELAAHTAREILDFEIGLAKGTIDEKSGLQLDEIAVLTTLDDMQAKYAVQDLDVKKLVNISLGGQLPTTEVYELFEGYQQNLIKLLKETPKRILANYIYFNLLDSFVVRTPDSKAELKSKCIDNTKKYFAKNLDNMIYRKYNTNDTEQGVEFMWREIQNTFQNVLLSPRLNWISEETRSYAEEKLFAMKLEINSYESTNFTQEFGQLRIDKNDFVQNLREIMTLSAQNQRQKLHEPPAPLDAAQLLSFTPANVIVENKIKVPVSLLQPFYVWSTAYPNAVKYATLGALISHELIHGFDDTGRNFDKVGNNRRWWDELSTNEFKARSNCFVDQYKRYEYNGRTLPEMASQSENIADNGGVRLAYAAYLRWYEEAVRAYQQMETEFLPRMVYTSKQLFFISYAQLWCGDIHPAIRNLQTSTDSHVPGKFRVIGPLSNFEEFSKEFNCPPGSMMNPVKKCSIY